MAYRCGCPSPGEKGGICKRCHEFLASERAQALRWQRMELEEKERKDKGEKK